jgi:hypothetical protein
VLDWKREFGRALSAREQTESEKEYFNFALLWSWTKKQDAIRETDMNISRKLE